VPFVVGGKKSYRKQQIGAHPVFIGRVDEIKFVQLQLIQPEIPRHNIVCFHGQGGIGKSTLLSQFEEIVGTNEKKGPPLFAYVNERQPTPVQVMQAFAKRLQMRGAFEKALELYTETLRKIRQNRQEAEETFGRKITGQVTKAVAESVPIVGTLIKEGVEQVSNLLWDEFHDRRRRNDAGHLEDPLRDLTQAFVSELNRHAESTGPRVFTDGEGSVPTFLCFDTFEYTAGQIEPWLLDTFLAEEIHASVVILIAGRNSLSLNPTHWLKYAADETLYQIEIKPFSREESRLYLAEAHITNETRADQIWKLSQGLPLYLRMLTFSRDVEIDPTENVVENFLRWIPADEPHKRRLLLEASLFSHPFNRDDLRAFSVIDLRRPSVFIPAADGH
jgi:energy-coupling factor transporter ATP-binding protein EcfA2